MKKIIAVLMLLALTMLMIPKQSFAAGGIYASGGKTITVGQTFTVSVVASGASFDTIDGRISISGPVSVVSFTPGNASAWMNQPSNGGAFSGAVVLGKTVTSFTVATIKLKGTGIGSGAVSVSNARLIASGNNVGSGSGGTNFKVDKAPDLPGKVKITSTTHPDTEVAYEATTIELSWTKDSGVDGFSYLLDQAADTTPAAKITDTNTSITYADKEIGTYYFHIRAHKADGWGSTSRFTINIKEPDAKINETLPAPSNIEISKDSLFENNIMDGTVTGITISGTTEPGFTANIALIPTPIIPEGKTLTAVADDLGHFSFLVDFPIASGFHKVTVQGQNDKILTPISDEFRFEITQAEGGNINMITDNDKFPPVLEEVEEADSSLILNKKTVSYAILGLFALIVIILLSLSYRKSKKDRSILREISRK